MTKFEEVKRPDNGPITELNNSMQSVLSQYRKMREYADYLEYDSKQKDEHILKLENENSFMRDERTTFDSSGMAVEPKLQQQALPVVPECVAKTVELLKKNPESSWSKLYSSLGEEGVTWLNDFQHKDERFGFGGLNSKLIVLFHLAINGYTVEKPQLYYLKHIDMSKSDAHLNWYLAKGTDNVLIHQGIKKGKSPKLKCILKLSQQEIDSMQTGSYEQIEVAE